MNSTDLSTYDNSWYTPGRKFKVIVWYFINAFVFKNTLFPFSKVKVIILRWFGAKIGSGVTIKPSVNIKYPWLLTVGDFCWIGENVWIDNLALITIGNNVCLSQGAMLLTGNHNYKKSTFDLMVSPINLEDGVWIGAKSIVAPGVRCGSHSVLTINSVATSDMESYFIYQGNPAQNIKARTIG